MGATLGGGAPGGATVGATLGGWAGCRKIGATVGEQIGATGGGGAGWNSFGARPGNKNAGNGASGAGGGAIMSVKMEANCWSTCICWALGCASNVAGLGCRSACVRSRAAAMASSVEEGTGIVTCVGNQATVGTTRSAEVAGTQTRWHR